MGGEEGADCKINSAIEMFNFTTINTFIIATSTGMGVWRRL